MTSNHSRLSKRLDDSGKARPISGNELAKIADYLAHARWGERSMKQLAALLAFGDERTFAEALCRAGWEIRQTLHETPAKLQAAPTTNPRARVLSQDEISDLRRMVEAGTSLNAAYGGLGFASRPALLYAMERQGLSVVQFLAPTPRRVKIAKAGKAKKQDIPVCG